MGDTIRYVEAWSDQAGRISLKFPHDGKDVWVSTVDEETGDILMERLNDDGTDRSTSGQQKKHGENSSSLLSKPKHSPNTVTDLYTSL